MEGASEDLYFYTRISAGCRSRVEPPIQFPHPPPWPDTDRCLILPARATLMTTAPNSETTAAPLPPLVLAHIAQDLQIRKTQVEAVVQLLDEGHTVPFIGRYRRERTGGLPEPAVRKIQERVRLFRQFADRKQTILKAIESLGKLSDDLKEAITSAEHPRRLEDLYLPFKPRKRPLATEARAQGLEQLAMAIWMRDPAVANLDEVVAGMLDPEKKLTTQDEVLAGVKLILAEMLSDIADIRGITRRFLWDTARLQVARHEKLPDGKGNEYKDFFQFSEPVQRIPPHRILAINRGERENALSVRLDFDAAALRQAIIDGIPQLADHPHCDLMLAALDEALPRAVIPSLAREIRNELTEAAQQHALDVFARNLFGLLMQPPVAGKRILAIDPGLRTGCRVAMLSETGELLDQATIHPHVPQKRRVEAKLILERLIRQHRPDVVAIGNGSAGRETEELVAELFNDLRAGQRGEVVPEPAPTPEPPVETIPVAITPPEPEGPSAESGETAVTGDVTISPPSESATPTETIVPPPETAAVAEAKPKGPPRPSPAEIIAKLRTELQGLADPPSELTYVMVNEAGASDYAANPFGREEFPQFDPALRSAITIGRRLQDPLSELVKIDPHHVGVGLYQHDLHGKHAKQFLEGVMESCVNRVGVDVNRAGAALLRHVSGFNQLIAREIVDHRQKHGPFKTLAQLAEIPSVGPNRLNEAAGFLIITSGDEPLDTTRIHLESYDIARQIIQEAGHTPESLLDPAKRAEMEEKFFSVNVEELAKRFQMSPRSVCDIMEALAHPEFDPRLEFPTPIFRRDVLKIDDLSPGMELHGTVLNVVDFGAFVDVGLKDCGLVHISQLADRYVRNPHEFLSVGDVVKVWVMNIDNDRKRVSLTMIAPGAARTVGDEHRHEEVPRERPRSFAPPGARPQPPRESRPQQRGPRPDGQRPRRGDRRHGRPSNEPVETEIAQDMPPPQRNLARLERKPPKPKPLPNLTREKREGKAYLNTLGELEAFFKAREGGQSPPPPPPPTE